MKKALYQVVSNFTHYEPFDTFKEAKKIAKELVEENEYDHITIVKLTETPFGSGFINEDIVWSSKWSKAR